ncbi:biotin--[acetyl-CoA-carboxylase] ligase [Thiohalorhabdus methylotrophus]|uniref:biotin--[biotin carboxyl-carrier protein] ligase n=1 Tax=Thiohalorhabdus methylotrophus TaxID=3242694 RepID=A0ABV4TSZ1_9GAMM
MHDFRLAEDRKDRLRSSVIAAMVKGRGGPPPEIRLWEEVDSTNVRLRELAETGLEPPVIAAAEHQTAGKGRRGRTWHSAHAGNLYLSLLTPLPSPVLMPWLPLLVGVAVAEVVEAAGGALWLKWPNDLLDTRERKVGGILVEASSTGRQRNGAVIGLGLNVNARVINPGGTEPGCLSEILGHQLDRNRLIGALFRTIQARMEAMQNQGPEGVHAAWLARGLWLGARVEVLLEAGCDAGVFEGLDAHGRIRVRTEEGEKRFAAGEISLRADAGGGT